MRKFFLLFHPSQGWKIVRQSLKLHTIHLLERRKCVNSCHTSIDVQPKRSIVYVKTIYIEWVNCWHSWFFEAVFEFDDNGSSKMNEKPTDDCNDYCHYCHYCHYWKGKLGNILLKRCYVSCVMANVRSRVCNWVVTKRIKYFGFDVHIFSSRSIWIFNGIGIFIRLTWKLNKCTAIYIYIYIVGGVACVAQFDDVSQILRKTMVSATLKLNYSSMHKAKIYINVYRSHLIDACANRHTIFSRNIRNGLCADGTTRSQNERITETQRTTPKCQCECIVSVLDFTGATTSSSHLHLYMNGVFSHKHKYIGGFSATPISEMKYKCKQAFGI